IDKDGDPSSPIDIHVTIKDGSDATGGDTSVTLTEADLDDAGASTYPLPAASGSLTLNKVTDDLVSNSLQVDPNIIDVLKGELLALTSGGNALDITISTDADGIITITATLKDSMDEALEIVLTPTADLASGNIDIAISVTQTLPLDHKSVTGTYVNVNDTELTIVIPVQANDIDNDPLTESANVTVIITDGALPVISAGTTAEIIESSVEIDGEMVIGGTGKGSVTLDVGSDAIDYFEWNVTQNTFDGLLTNGVSTDYTVTKNIIEVYSIDASGNRVDTILTITMNTDGTFDVV
ncbi:hypothetical protein, partial [Vibrio rumoiensis]|uniref:hypothetical protein n=1 Tax=Vibrio rumoiensis TaxID=76258 RepID=UPI0005858264